MTIYIYLHTRIFSSDYRTNVPPSPPSPPLHPSTPPQSTVNLVQFVDFATGKEVSREEAVAYFSDLDVEGEGTVDITYFLSVRG